MGYFNNLIRAVAFGPGFVLHDGRLYSCFVDSRYYHRVGPGYSRQKACLRRRESRAISSAESHKKRGQYDDDNPS